MASLPFIIGTHVQVIELDIVGRESRTLSWNGVISRVIDDRFVLVREEKSGDRFERCVESLRIRRV